jgi:hypothetical protein
VTVLEGKRLSKVIFTSEYVTLHQSSLVCYPTVIFTVDTVSFTVDTLSFTVDTISFTVQFTVETVDTAEKLLIKS